MGGGVIGREAGKQEMHTVVFGWEVVLSGWAVGNAQAVFGWEVVGLWEMQGGQ